MNPYFQGLGDAILKALTSLWDKFIGFLPNFLGALVILLIGWIIAISLGVVAARIVLLLRIDKALEKLNLKKALERAGISFSADRLVGWLVKWFFIIVFLIAAAEILKWTAVTGFLTDIVLYLPNVIIAVVVLLVGLVVGGFVGEIVKKAVGVTRLGGSDFLSLVARWAIVIFALMAALVQLGVAAALIQTLFTGLVAMLALAAGLAFGLGGKDLAGKVLDGLRRNITKKD